MTDPVDLINHPPHYTSHPSGVECIEIVEHFNCCIGQAVQYLWRAGLKEGNDTIQDLSKARWFVDREIDRLKREQLLEEKRARQVEARANRVQVPFNCDKV